MKYIFCTTQPGRFGDNMLELYLQEPPPQYSRFDEHPGRMLPPTAPISMTALTLQGSGASAFLRQLTLSSGGMLGKVHYLRIIEESLSTILEVNI